MRKFYMIMLAVLMCVAGTAMAKPSANDGTPQRTVNLSAKKQLRDIKSIVKKEKPTGLAKMKNCPPQVKANLEKLQQLGGKKVLGARKADAETTIEGTWTFTLGDWYFTSSVNGFITYDFEASLEGSQVLFEDPTHYEAPFVADYDEATGKLTFTREFVATASSYYIYQEPYVYNYDAKSFEEQFDYQDIVGTYNASAGTITFEEDNGISWPLYTAKTNTHNEDLLYGYYGIYDLDNAVKATAGGDEDDSAWEDLGEATLEDPWFVPAIGDQHNANYQWNVPLQRNVENPNLYRLVDPYHIGPAKNYNSSKNVGYITFDATDPNHVVFLPTEAGFANSGAGISQFYCLNALGLYVGYFGMSADMIVSILGEDAMPYTTFKDNKITFGYIEGEDGTMYDACFGDQDDPYGGYIWTDENRNPVDMTGSITFPSLGDDNDTDTPTVDNIYYQLNREDYTAQVTGCVDFLTALDIPETINVTSGTYVVTSVKDNAFYNNRNISSITIPATIKEVGTDAFRNLTNLRTLNIANLEDWIAIEFANGNANPLYNVFPTSTSQWGKVYIAGEEVTDLVIPEGVTAIGRSFYGFKALKSVTLPSTLTYIEAQAFNNCEGLTEITFPAALTGIGNMAFYGAKNIEKVTCYATVPPTCGYMNFTNFSSKAPLYVPTESVEAYQNAAEWEDFTNIIGVDVPVETIGTYTMNIQPTDISATRESEPAEITVEVQKQGQTYYLVETGETNYFKGQKAPFTYNQTTGMATFEQTYVGKTDDEGFAEYPYLWSAGFVATTMAEPQPQFAVPFDVENGFDFSENTNAGIAWYGSDSDTEFMPFDAYAAFFGALSEVAETVGTYTWSILPTTMAGEKTGEADVVEIEVEVKKQGDNYWIAEAGTTNYFNDQVISFTYNDATKYAEFTPSYAGEVDGNHIWFSAFIYNAGGFTEPQPTYTAKFTAENGFEFTSGDAGFAWYITENADEFNPVDVYKAFYVNPTFEVEEGDYGDASIEGEWEITTNDHYAGDWSKGEETLKYNATLDGNTVTFEDEYGGLIVAKFTAENTLTFNVVAVGNPASYTLTQNPFTDGTKVSDLGIDPENFVFEPFTATYDKEAGTITFTEGTGLAYGYADAGGNFSYYDYAFDFISAKKATGEDNPSTSINAIDAANANADAIFYDLNGRRVNTPKAGLYIMKSGNTVQKVVVE